MVVDQTSWAMIFHSFCFSLFHSLAHSRVEKTYFRSEEIAFSCGIIKSNANTSWKSKTIYLIFFSALETWLCNTYIYILSFFLELSNCWPIIFKSYILLYLLLSLYSIISMSSSYYLFAFSLVFSLTFDDDDEFSQFHFFFLGFFIIFVSVL